MIAHFLNPITIKIGIIFTTSLIFGFAALKNYDLVVKALQERNLKKQYTRLWWAFSSLIFGFLLVLYAFFKGTMRM